MIGVVTPAVTSPWSAVNEDDQWHPFASVEAQRKREVTRQHEAIPGGDFHALHVCQRKPFERWSIREEIAAFLRITIPEPVLHWPIVHEVRRNPSAIVPTSIDNVQFAIDQCRELLEIGLDRRIENRPFRPKPVDRHRFRLLGQRIHHHVCDIAFVAFENSLSLETSVRLRTDRHETRLVNASSITPPHDSTRLVEPGSIGRHGILETHGVQFPPFAVGGISKLAGGTAVRGHSSANSHIPIVIRRHSHEALFVQEDRFLFASPGVDRDHVHMSRIAGV